MSEASYPALRRALRLAPDDLGHWWLWHGDRRIELVFHQQPGDTPAVGRQIAAVRFVPLTGEH